MVACTDIAVITARTSMSGLHQCREGIGNLSFANVARNGLGESSFGID